MKRALALALAATACGSAHRAAAQAGASAEAAFAADYLGFLDAARTPSQTVEVALAAGGWRAIDPRVDAPAALGPGERVVFVDRGRSAVFAIAGRRPLARAGARLIAAHIDTPSPRARAGVVVDRRGRAHVAAYRYGGARPHHWAGIPLALVGQVVRADGTQVELRIGLGDDAAFTLYAISADDEQLEAIVATAAPGQGRASASVLEHLRERYGLERADLDAAELYLVPAWRPREVGLDRALLGGHGQDDRVNAFASWRALDAVDGIPERYAMTWWIDREEIGSTGPVGARSRFLELVYAWLIRAEGGRADEPSLGRAFAATRALSADTPAALNPNFPEPHVARLAPRLGAGPVAFPYAGSRGKSGSHTAGAPIMAAVRRVFAEAGVPLQFAELGKVEAGGGGTVSKFLAERGIEVIDLGIPVVGMHSPFELTAKRDLWHGYLGFRAWLCQRGCSEGGSRPSSDQQ